MSVEGLRAWIAEVERKLAKRTRVFLALSVIAIGIACASVYLAIDARNSSVSESDVQALQQQLEERIDGGDAAPTPPVEPEPAPEPEPGPQGNGGNGQDGASSKGGANAGGAADSAQIQDLLEQAKERSEESE